MGKTRNTGFSNNAIQYNNGSITFVSGSTTLLNISSSGAIVTTGTITANTLVVQTVTSSVSFVTGSTKFGAISANTHQFTGSVYITGSNLNVGGTTITDGHLMNIVGNQSLVNVGVVLNNTNATYSRIYGLTNVNNNFVLYDYTTSATRLSVNPSGSIGIGTTVTNYAKLNVYNNTNDGTYGAKIQAIFGNADYQDSDATQNYGSGTSETQFLVGSTARPAMLSLGGDINAGEAVGVINFFRSTNTDTYRSRAWIWSGLNTTGTANQYGGYLAFSTAADNGTNPQERMRIDSDGNMAIKEGNLSISRATNVNGSYQQISFPQGVYTKTAIRSYSAGTTDAGELRFYTAPAGDIVNERMRILSEGYVYINATTNPLPSNATPQLGILAGTNTDAVNLKHTQNGNNTLNIWQTGTTSHNAIAFYKGDSQTSRGLITVTTSGTTYNSVSDYRLKENITPLENGLDRVLQLKPSKFNWIETGNESEGFIAHELQEYFPDAVTGEKDAVYSSTGNIKPQSVDYGRITPLLVKAIQELKAENDALKTRIETLENK
jgi:hypothetical protein